MADKKTKKKPSTIFGGLIGNAAIKIEDRESRVDDAVGRMSRGDAALTIPSYEERKKKRK